jgi:delta 1-pyrroline-5-carboxylate dehydrogenase
MLRVQGETAAKPTNMGVELQMIAKPSHLQVPGIASGMLIDGQIVAGTSFFDVTDPATGKPFALAPDASHEQLELAVAAAKRAFAAWSRTDVAERRTTIAKVAAL